MVIKTANGDLSLPNFAPDATRASIRGLKLSEAKKSGVEVLVINTYHLMLKPGLSVIKQFDGAHNFMNWHLPIASDSGGYQVFSLVHKNSSLGKVTDDGVKFKNVYNGDWEFLSPEKSIETQFVLGSDIMVLLDDVRPNDRDKDEIYESIKRTIDWAKRAKLRYLSLIEEKKFDSKTRPKLVAVIQGGPFEDLREYCADELLKLEDGSFKFDGFGFGGSHLDSEGNIMENIIAKTAMLAPKDRFLFALGVGRPSDIKVFKKYGWQLFDCTIPTREARHGKIFIKEEDDLKEINIKNSIFKKDTSPIDVNCNCGCAEYSKAYIHHLFNVNDFVAFQIMEKHNLKVYTDFVRGVN